MPLIANSATWLGDEHRGAVVVCGSHGGTYPAYLAARCGVRAILLSDAGCGLERAGVAGLTLLADLGIAAVAIDAWTARIGDAVDMAERGRVSVVNEPALALGCAPGLTCSDAARLLENALPVERRPSASHEARQTLCEAPLAVHLLDSIALVEPDDAGAFVVSGSHGGLIGSIRTAVKVDVLAAVFHDAGGGIDDAGYGRLPALDALGIFGATVDGATARIGDARSLWETGLISRCNSRAREAGIEIGMGLREMAVHLAAFASAQQGG